MSLASLSTALGPTTSPEVPLCYLSTFSLLCKLTHWIVLPYPCLRHPICDSTSNTSSISVCAYCRKELKWACHLSFSKFQRGKHSGNLHAILVSCGAPGAPLPVYHLHLCLPDIASSYVLRVLSSSQCAKHLCRHSDVGMNHFPDAILALLAVYMQLSIFT